MARWIDDDPKVICRSDPSSRDSIEPVRSQVPKHPPGMGGVVLRGTTHSGAFTKGIMNFGILGSAHC